MRRPCELTHWIVSLCLASLCASVWASGPAQRPGTPAASRRIALIVQLKDADGPSLEALFRTPLAIGDDAGRAVRIAALRANAAASQQRFLSEMAPALGLGRADVRRFWMTNALAFEVAEGSVEAIAGRPDVKGVALDRPMAAPGVAPSTPPTAPAAHTWGLARMRVPETRALYRLSGKGVRVGHLDTGAIASHPDLTGKIALFHDFNPAARKQTPIDDDGHGTHTAGTIAGGRASGCQIGVAPGAQLIVGRMLGGFRSSTSVTLAAMEWVVDPDGDPRTADGAQIVSCSWGRRWFIPKSAAGVLDFVMRLFEKDPNRVHWDAAQRWVDLGVFGCFATGNDAEMPGTPAALPHAFAVGASEPDDSLCSFSNWGPALWDEGTVPKPQVVAPGFGVLSAWPGGNGYAALEGTSMACPHAAGVAALVLEANPGLTVRDLANLLESSAKDAGAPGRDPYFGAGRIDAWRAAARAAPGGELRVTLKDAAGRPLEGHVRLVDFGITMRTDSAGRAVLPVPAGRYLLETDAIGCAPARYEAITAPGRGYFLDATLERASETIVRGTVKNREGRPLFATVIAGAGIACETDSASGAFTLRLPRGKHTLVALSGTGYEPRRLDGVELSKETEELHLVLDTAPGILLVDDDWYERHDEYFTASLTRLNRKFSVWDTTRSGNVHADALSSYPAVLWESRAARPCFGEAERAAVERYLENGGRLLISGHEAAAELLLSDDPPAFLHVRFAGVLCLEPIRGICPTPTNPFPALEGDEGIPAMRGLRVELNGPDSGGNQEVVGLLRPRDGRAKTLLAFAGAPGNGVAVSTEIGDSKVVLLGFGFEGIRGAPARDRFLARMLEILSPDAGWEDHAALRRAMDEGVDAPGVASRLDAAEKATGTRRSLATLLSTERARLDPGRARAVLESWQRDPGRRDSTLLEFVLTAPAGANERRAFDVALDVIGHQPKLRRALWGRLLALHSLERVHRIVRRTGWPISELMQEAASRELPDAFASVLVELVLGLPQSRALEAVPALQECFSRRPPGPARQLMLDRLRERSRIDDALGRALALAFQRELAASPGPAADLAALTREAETQIARAVGAAPLAIAAFTWRAEQALDRFLSASPAFAERHRLFETLASGIEAMRKTIDRRDIDCRRQLVEFVDQTLARHIALWNLDSKDAPRASMILERARADCDAEARDAAAIGKRLGLALQTLAPVLQRPTPEGRPRTDGLERTAPSGR